MFACHLKPDLGDWPSGRRGQLSPNSLDAFRASSRLFAFERLVHLSSDRIDRCAGSTHFRFQEYHWFGTQLTRLAQIFVQTRRRSRLTIPMQSAVSPDSNVIHGRHEADEVMGLLPITIRWRAGAIGLGLAARKVEADPK